MIRDKKQTEQKLLDAVGQLLAKQGFEGVGINAVAKAAGVDKVLIYRYFGGLEELLEAYGRAGDFWWTAEEVLEGSDALPPDAPLEAWLSLGLRNTAKALRRRPVTQAILAWELHGRNELTDALARTRQEETERMQAIVASAFGVDPASDEARLIVEATTVVGASINYMVLRSRTVDTWGGIDITTDEGWEHMSGVIDVLVYGAIAELRKRMASHRVEENDA